MLNFKMMWVLVLLAAASAASVSAESTAPSGVKELSQQVWALRSLYELDLTDRQLRALKSMAALAGRPVGSTTQPVKSKVPEKFITALRSMREALIKRDDEDQISELQDDLESLREDDDIDIDDQVTLTPEARAKVPEFLRLLTASQSAGYIAKYQDEIPDPLETLMDAADDARGTDDQEYKSTAGEAADEVSSLLAGLNVEKAKPIADQVRAWLNRSRAMSEVEFKSKRDDLEKSAREIVGDVDSLTVVRHWMERDLAELLSNPQLTAAIDARMP